MFAKCRLALAILGIDYVKSLDHYLGNSGGNFLPKKSTNKLPRKENSEEVEKSAFNFSVFIPIAKPYHMG